VTPFKTAVEPPTIEAPESPDAIVVEPILIPRSQQRPPSGVTEQDENSNKTGTIRLYFANQSVRDEDRELADTVVLPINFDEYMTVVLYHPHDEESRWIEEKGLRSWMEQQKHRIFNVGLKIKRRHDGNGLYVKFKYQDGLYGLTRTYYGDVNIKNIENGKCLHCTIYTDHDIYIMELNNPPANQENIMDGKLYRDEFTKGSKSRWDAAVVRPQSKVHVVTV